MKQLATLESFNHREAFNASPFRQTKADYICSSSYFVVSLCESYIYIYVYIYICIYIYNALYLTNLCVHGVNTCKCLWHQWEGSTNNRYNSTSWFTSAGKYKLIKLLTFIFAQRYLPKPANLFTQFWKFCDFKLTKKEIDAMLILSIIAKEKSDWMVKSENVFWFHTSITSRPKMTGVNCYGSPKKCPQKMINRGFLYINF